jgi:hypothetical protein
VILIDSNIPMYLVGSPHPHKTDAQRLLEKLISARERLVTDAEVPQEILHRYVAINRRDAIQPACDVDADVAQRANRLFSAIGSCRPATPCILQLWSKTASGRSSASIRALTRILAFHECHRRSPDYLKRCMFSRNTPAPDA